MQLPTSSIRMREFIAYFAASIVALGVDVAVLALLVTKMGVGPLTAACISFLTGAVALYFISTSLVFGYRRYDDARIEFTLFIAIGILGFAINAVVIYLLAEKLRLHFLLAKAVAAACTFGANYLLRQTFLFSAVPRASTGESTSP